MKSVFEFTERNGNNCLMISFHPMQNYKDETKKNPTSSTGMFTEIETTILYLIVEGEKHGVEISTILNTSSKSGGTRSART